jgi:hypothetical protein
MDRSSPYFKPESNYTLNGLEGYAEYFPDYSGQPVLMEATTRYIYQNTAREVFAGLKPQPNVIFLLREPCSRLMSAFLYAKNNRASIRPETSFPEFVDALRKGQVDSLVQFDHDSHAGRAYHSELTEMRDEMKYGQYIDYLLPWKQSLLTDRLHVFLMEDMQRSPVKFMHTIASIIGIDAAFYDGYDFTPRNRSVHVRSPGIQRLVRRLAPLVPRSRWTRAMYLKYLKLQAREHSAADKFDKDTLRLLRDHYRPYNRRLAEEFRLDLWQ